MRRSRLERRTELRTRSELKRRTGLRSRSANTHRPPRWETWRRFNYDEVRRRSLVCEVPGCSESWTERHHPFGRSAEPWSSSHLLLVLLCVEHHRQVTGKVGAGLDRARRELLRMIAVTRMARFVAEVEAAMFGECQIVSSSMDPTQRFELTRDIAASAGIEPPGYGSWKNAERSKR